MKDIKKKQPILIGTTSVENSETISKILYKNNIAHQVLNAKVHDQEANIILQAGIPGKVTISTNMAGRGVDIKLGGNIEEMTLLAAKNEDKLDDIDFINKKRQENEKTTIEEREQVLKLGGLYVIGTERHESRRNDNQLRGRSGRQGDPGESRFFISLEDDLMRRFQGERIQSIMDKLNLPDDERIEQNMVTKSIERAQAQVESLNFEIRKNVLKFDQVLNQQREVIYKWRRKLLVSEDISDLIYEWLDDLTETIQKNIDSHKQSYENKEHFEMLINEELNSILNEVNKNKLLETKEINDYLEVNDSLKSLFQDNSESHASDFWNIARMASLSFIDQFWKTHLSEMDYLRSGIGLRAMGQRDPLVEYQKEGYDLFEELVFNVKTSVIRLLLNFDSTIIKKEANEQKEKKEINRKEKGTNFKKIGRNDPCHCGSGLKYKKCHG